MALTVFCLGSGQKYQPDKPDKANINTRFFEACAEPKLIVDGPQKFAGAYDPQKIKENITHIVNAIMLWLEAEAIKNPNGPHQINLTGFSRGAVTTLKIANALNEALKDSPLKDKIELNIYAEDPVAGMSDKRDPHAKIIPPIVKNYVAVVQTDERRRGFKPQDLSRVQVKDCKKTNVTFLPLYGNHSEVIKVRKEKTKDCPLINWDLKFKFLQQHGTKFNAAPALVCGKLNVNPLPVNDPVAVLKSYDSAKKNRKKYQQKAMGFQMADMPTPGMERSFNQNLHHYVRDPDIFVNQHHRELVKQVYPDVFKWVFEMNREGNENTQANANAQLVNMRKEHPQLLADLVKKNKIIKEGEHFAVDKKPSGTARIEHCRLTNSLEGKPVEPFSDFELFEREVFQATIQYQRGKPEYMAMSSRTEFDRATKIREEVDEIISNPKIKDSRKKLDAMAYIGEQITDMHASGSKSKLCSDLEQVLKNNGYKVTFDPGKNPNTALKEFGNVLKTTGQGIQRFGRVVNTVVGGIGQGMVSFGKRAMEITTRGKGWIFAIVGVPVGAVLYGAGQLVKTAGRAIDWLGGKIRSAGANLIKSSHAYDVIINEIPKEPTEPKAVNGSLKTIFSEMEINPNSPKVQPSPEPVKENELKVQIQPEVPQPAKAEEPERERQNRLSR